MKAWMVSSRYEGGAEVVFAETRGKARSIALCTECCEDVSFIDIEVRRMPQADKYYEDGKWHLDWLYSQDRIILVRDCGFVCDPDYWEHEDCEICPAKEHCDQYKDLVAGGEDNG